MTPLIIWMTCAFLAHGLIFASWQHQRYGTHVNAEFYRGDFAASLLWSLIFGPITLLVAIWLTRFGKDGFRLW